MSLKRVWAWDFILNFFPRNCTLNLKSLPEENGTCAKSSSFWRTDIFKMNISLKLLIEFISPCPSGNYSAHVLAWLNPLGFKSYVWKMSSGWYSLIMKLKMGVMWICYSLLMQEKRDNHHLFLILIITCETTNMKFTKTVKLWKVRHREVVCKQNLCCGLHVRLLVVDEHWISEFG